MSPPGKPHNAIATKFVILLIMVLILLVPMFIALVGVVYWNYGQAYAEACIRNPQYFMAVLQSIFSYWQTYHANPAFQTAFSLHLFSPPFISLFFSLTLLFM